MDTDTHQQDHLAGLRQLTDACVACGMCLPSCPTYQQGQTEAESPRGRISLVKALTTGQLEADEQVMEHLEACMLCRTCERICPAKVEFGKIMDEARHEVVINRHRALHPQEVDMLNALDDMKRLDARFSLLRMVDKLHLRHLAGWSLKWVNPGFNTVLQQLPRVKGIHRYKEVYPTASSPRGQVMLFIGCVARYIDQHTIDAAIRLLNLLGYEVLLPPEQQCCGAIHQHAGLQEHTHSLLLHNQEAFGSDSITPVIGLATGCTSHLQDMAERDTDVSFPGRVVDIIDLLARDEKLASMKFSEVAQKVVLHIPCSQRNVLRQEEQVRKLLELIPGLQLRELPSAISCCGAAGTYMFTHADKANRQRQQVLDQLNPQQDEILISSNIGCAMHISQGLAQAGLAMRVMHPVEFLLEALDTGKLPA